MPKYKIHTFIFEAGSDDGAAARIKMYAPEVSTQTIRQYLWVFDFNRESWVQVEPPLINSLYRGPRISKLFTVCDYLASAQRLRQLKIPDNYLT